VDYSPRQEYSGAFEEADIPEEEKLKENLVSRGKALKWRYIPKEYAVNRRKVVELYTKPPRRPLYSLQVLCLIAISRNNHPKEQIYTLFYDFKQPESEEYYWKINISDPHPRPINLNLKPYTELQLVRYIKPRFLDWVKAGGYQQYIQRKGWVSAQGIGEPFYIDLWKVIEEKESRLLEIETSTVQNVCQQETDKETRNHTPGK
jgi:hypothetical protein